MDVDLEAPDHTTLSRRSRALDIELHRVPVKGPIHLIVESTGLSIVGEGEWAAAKHGGRGQRGWKKLHLGVDRLGVIVAHTLTEATVDDATTAIGLIEALAADIARVTADAAYDTIAFYATATARGATVVVPPSKTARVSRRRPRSSARDRTIKKMKKIGRRRWKKEAGYHRQAQVENAFFRYKLIIGDGLRARSPGGRVTEADGLPGLGRPEAERRHLDVSADVARGYVRRQATSFPAPCRRRGPIGAAPDDVLVAHIRRVLEASPFHGEGYRKVGAKLRVEGRRTAKERVRRLMREHDLQAPSRTGHAHGPKAHDGTITTEAPDVMWGTDMTATVTVAEGPAFVFVAVDHCTAECIGLHAAKRGTRFEALEPIRQGIRERFGGIGDGVARGLRLRHDHGSNYLADDFQQAVAFFGIESSPSFVREPEGNGVAERFIRTLKENLLWVQSFETIEELRLALLAFKRTYNEQWMLEKYDYRSPAQVRRDLVGLDAVA